MKERNKRNAEALARDQRKQKWKSEMIFKQFLEREGIKFKHQQPFWGEDYFYSGDFYLKKRKILIEIDGKNHRAKHDLIRSVRLVKSGKVKEIIRITNWEIYKNPQKIYDTIVLKLK